MSSPLKSRDHLLNLLYTRLQLASISGTPLGGAVWTHSLCHKVQHGDMDACALPGEFSRSLRNTTGCILISKDTFQAVDLVLTQL